MTDQLQFQLYLCEGDISRLLSKNDLPEDIKIFFRIPFENYGVTGFKTN